MQEGRREGQTRSSLPVAGTIHARIPRYALFEHMMHKTIVSAGSMTLLSR